MRKDHQVQQRQYRRTVRYGEGFGVVLQQKHGGKLSRVASDRNEWRVSGQGKAKAHERRSRAFASVPPFGTRYASFFFRCGEISSSGGVPCTTEPSVIFTSSTSSSVG